MLLQYSTYRVIYSIKVRTVIGGHRSGVTDEVCDLTLQQLFHILRCCLLLRKQ